MDEKDIEKLKSEGMKSSLFEELQRKVKEINRVTRIEYSFLSFNGYQDLISRLSTLLDDCKILSNELKKYEIEVNTQKD